MPRATTEPGQWGRITLVPEVRVTRDDREVWVESTEGKPDRWRATTRVRDADDGVLRQVARYARTKTRAEADLLVELRTRQERRAVAARQASSETVGAAAETWLSEERGRLAGTTHDTYGQALHRHVVSSPIGTMLLGEVKPSDVNRLLDQVTKGSGPGAAKLVRSVLRGTFERAVHLGHAEFNPVTQARSLRQGHKPKPAEGERDTRRALTALERACLMAYADADPYAQRHDLPDLIAFLAGTGVRLGEAMALRWTHVDLDAETALIAATVTRVKGEGLKIQESTKTAQDRVVHLPPWLADRLRSRPRTGATVFPTSLGNLRDRSNTSKLLREVYVGAGFPWMTSHTLRRTAATMMDEAKLSIGEIANALGHARPSMTMDVYLDRRQSAERAAGVL